MATKRSTNKRIFEVARELGVTSKDVISKCKAEGIPGITNHMSTVSLGLSMTIKEWFASGGGGTAVETAARVDVEEARARAAAKTRTRTKATATVTATTATTATPQTEEPVEPPPPVIETTATVIGTAPVEAPTNEAPPVAPVVEAPSAPPPAVPAVPVARAPEAAPPPTDDGAAVIDDGAAVTDDGAAVTDDGAGVASPEEALAGPKMNVPDRPTDVKPAGPQLTQPDRVKLAGPKIIRVEQPDVVPRPQPRARGGGRVTTGGRGVAGPLPGGPAATPRGGRTGTPSSRRNKRRTASGRDEGRGVPPKGGESKPFNWREQDLLERERRLNRSGGFFRAARRDNQKRTSGGGHRARTAAESGGTVRVAEPITIKDLSGATGVKAAEIVKRLFMAGFPTTINSTLPTEKAHEIMAEFEIELEVVEQKSAEEQIRETFIERDMVDEQSRPPVVTILGHVDHGKTSLLDRIRHTDVAAGEAGGITQATSAFQVPVTVGEGNRVVTFIDTPGHEAFTEMRSRGAKVTDVVVLVVAADDGVMPQTLESINHAKAADVPIVVALNKIDKPEATDSNIQRILGQLAEHELNPVEWGGSTEVVRLSALKNEGITDLLEVLDFQAQLLELTADHGGSAQGAVLEARLEEGRGPVANILVQQGKLAKGDFIVVGRAFGRVRDIVDDRGQRIDEAGPSMPVAVSGINAVPDAGDAFYCVDSLKKAEAAAQERQDEERQRELKVDKVTLDNIFDKLAEQQRTELPLIVKGDVQGSVDTLCVTLEKLSTDEITIAIKHSAVGGVNDSDILLADTTGAIIIGFNVTTSSKARKLAEAKGVDIRLYDVIYDVTDDVRKAAEGLLEPEYKLEVIGHADVRQVFRVSKVGMIAGCYVTDGVIERNTKIRVTRQDIVVEKDRKLDQLKRFKDDAKEVRSGQECGMRIDGYDDIKVGDVIECYRTLEVARTL